MNLDPILIINKMKSDKHNLFISEHDFVTAFILAAKEIYPNLIYIREYPYNPTDICDVLKKRKYWQTRFDYLWWSNSKI